MSRRNPLLHVTTLILLGCLVVGAAAGTAQAVPVQDDDGAPTTSAPVQERPDIIQKPDTGQPPQDAGDRGGALQAIVFAAMLAGLGGIGTLALRESRRRSRSVEHAGTGDHPPDQA